MTTKKERMLTIPVLLAKLKESEDLNEIIIYENKLASMIASPLMYFTAISSFLVVYLFYNEPIQKSILTSLIFIVLGFMFDIFSRIKINPIFASHIISILYGVIPIVALIRLYEYMGPSVWSIYCLQLGFSIYRTRKEMTTFVGLSTLLSIVYVFINLTKFKIELTLTFFISQFILLGVIFIVFITLHKLNQNRIYKLDNKIETIIKQNNDIAALYEEISATDEELKLQNRRLKERDRELFDLAYFDPLTSLPNRQMFTEFLEEQITYSIEKDLSFYLISIDVDFFKKINDTMGHNVGDFFIKFVAERLNNSINEYDFLCRTGGDEFSIVVTRDINGKTLLKEMNSLRKKFYDPFKVQESEFRLTASFGVSVFPRDGNTFEDLIKHSDIAMNHAKTTGKNCVCFFDKKLKDQVLEKTTIENEMLKGLENNEFYLMFQPQYNLSDQKIRSFEVLARWESKTLGLVPPLKFIPIAEETGFINQLGNWILRNACLKFNQIKHKYDIDLMLSVNISSLQFKNSTFLEEVKAILKETKFDPKKLEFELTESICIESFEEVYHTLSELKKIGIKVALDDFGTGYSSLSYLKKLPLDIIKIDKFFIDEIIKPEEKNKVVGDIISLGHSLGFEIVAEGVEFREQQSYLTEHSCNFVQGYLFNKPLKENEVNELFNYKP